MQEPRPWFPTLPALLRKQSYDWGQSVQERFVGLLAPQPSRGQIQIKNEPSSCPDE